MLKTSKMTPEFNTDQKPTKHDGSGGPRKISLWWERTGGAVSARICGTATI